MATVSQGAKVAPTLMHGQNSPKFYCQFGTNSGFLVLKEHEGVAPPLPQLLDGAGPVLQLLLGVALVPQAEIAEIGGGHDGGGGILGIGDAQRGVPSAQQ